MARWIALLMLILLAAEPSRRVSVPVPPRCLLAIDDSLSMLDNIQNLPSVLATKTTYLSDCITGVGSPLGNWLIELAKDNQADVVCLISDGITTHGAAISDAARHFRVPVFCVAMGSDTVATNPPVLFDDTVTPIKCLFIERSPRPEYRFLRDVLQQLDECTLQTVLLDADEQTNLTADEIDNLDLVIIGDVDVDKLPARLLQRPVLFITGEHTASQPGTPLTFDWSDDPVLPLQRRNTKSTVRWGVPIQPNNAAAATLRVLARVGEQPLIAIDETLRRCWCGTDELYRLADDNIDPNNREFWRRLITLLARAPRGEPDESFVRSRYEDFDEQIESRRKHRDIIALKSLAEITGGELFVDSDASEVAAAIDKRFAGITHYEIRKVPLIPRWILFTVAIVCLLWAWTKENTSKRVRSS